MIHHDFTRGKRVLVILRSGERFFDRYVERKSEALVFEERGRIPIKKIRSTTIARGV